MNRYASQKDQYQENIQFEMGNNKIRGTRTKNLETTTDDRDLPAHAFDLVSGYYLLRTFPKDMRGCAIR